MQSSRIKIGGATLNQIPLDWQGNQDRILQAITQAKQEGVAILGLPELCLSGYGCEDAFHAAGVSETAWQMLMGILPHTSGITVAVGIPIHSNHVLYNALALVCDGCLRGIAVKQFLPGEDLYYEPRWFKPWPAGDVRTLRAQDVSVQIGRAHV